MLRSVPKSRGYLKCAKDAVSLGCLFPIRELSSACAYEHRNVLKWKVGLHFPQLDIILL